MRLYWVFCHNHSFFLILAPLAPRPLNVRYAAHGGALWDFGVAKLAAVFVSRTVVTLLLNSFIRDAPPLPEGTGREAALSEPSRVRTEPKERSDRLRDSFPPLSGAL